ncbi:hypothetical protein TcasGA2_TC012694 [Tribolium castaneum]|uniref:Uncharacterized protein n=1 Tax=Tribolium castaneum TaxID=7070 RepID=D6WZM5_TRICA|nr:hypothetical protein TcasGA2_TC012694 [Tribolium castaneum]
MCGGLNRMTRTGSGDMCSIRPPDMTRIRWDMRLIINHFINKSPPRPKFRRWNAARLDLYPFIAQYSFTELTTSNRLHGHGRRRRQQPPPNYQQLRKLSLCFTAQNDRLFAIKFYN